MRVAAAVTHVWLVARAFTVHETRTCPAVRTRLEPHLCVLVVEWGAWIDHHVRSRVCGVSCVPRGSLNL